MRRTLSTGAPTSMAVSTMAVETLSRRLAMSIGVSIFLLVVGAILTFAVEVSASGFNINTVGIILMLAGALGLLLSLLFLSSFSPWSRRRTARGGTVIEERRIDRDLP
jgi:type IV secretory pathway VirB3-like protein